MPTTSIFNTQRHQLMVMEVMQSAFTEYNYSTEAYSTDFFSVKDADFDYGEMSFDDLEVFTDKVRIACSIYLERQNQGLIK